METSMSNKYARGNSGKKKLPKTTWGKNIKKNQTLRETNSETIR